jgi:competence protein ComFB
MYQVANLMEKVVREVLEDILPTLSGFCGCERCRADVICWALNQLPPRYVSYRYGEILSEAEFESAQRRAEVIATLMHAVRRVQSLPHDDRPSRSRHAP